MGEIAVNAAARVLARVIWLVVVAASTALFAATSCLWAVSFRGHPGLAVDAGPVGTLSAGVVRGHLVIIATDPDPPHRWAVRFVRFFDDWDLLLDPNSSFTTSELYDAGWLYDRRWHYPLGSVAHRVWLGFQTEVPSPPLRSGFERVLFVPDWFLAAVFGVLPYRAVRRWRSARRDRLVGRCRRCGYDLRASPGRCPECGTPAATADRGAISTSS